MKSNRIYFFLLLFYLIFDVKAQKGILIRNCENDEPIPYALMESPNEIKYADSNGFINLNRVGEEPIYISSLGYHAKSLEKLDSIVCLDKENYLLNEIVLNKNILTFGSNKEKSNTIYSFKPFVLYAFYIEIPNVDSIQLRSIKFKIKNTKKLDASGHLRISVHASDGSKPSNEPLLEPLFSNVFGGDYIQFDFDSNTPKLNNTFYIVLTRMKPFGDFKRIIKSDGRTTVSVEPYFYLKKQSSNNIWLKEKNVNSDEWFNYAEKYQMPMEVLYELKYVEVK